MRADPREVRFIDPVELKRGDGRRGVATAYVDRDLFVISLRDDETWMKAPAGGILIMHPSNPPMWCRFDGTTYLRSQVERH
jgi:hypothetical protein